MNEQLVDRMREVVASRTTDVVEKRMFGGMVFMVNGHMSVGVTNKGHFMARVGNERYDELLENTYARPMDFTKRPMEGYLFIEDAGVDTKAKLGKWVDASLEYVRGLPPKKPKKR